MRDVYNCNRMLRQIWKRTFGTAKTLEGLVDFRKDSYNAVHLTPKEALDSAAF
jgi:hypothetical protein